jgi:uncharacterized protein YdeI (YjbR/CyaY-like superfamily)
LGRNEKSKKPLERPTGLDLKTEHSIMVKTENFEKLEVVSAQQLRDWLEVYHAQSENVWLVTYKKPVREKHIPHDEVLDELLCFGWIDGVARKLDDQRTMQLIGPRRVHHWAKTYKDRAARLTSEGRMHASGLHAIAESKRKGLWSFMDDVDALEIPNDLLEVLLAHPPAADHFECFSNSSKRFVLRWIKLAKTPKTRTKRIETTALLAAQNLKIPGS